MTRLAESTIQVLANTGAAQHPLLSGASNGMKIAALPAFKNASSNDEKHKILCTLRELDESGAIRIQLPCASQALLAIDAGDPDGFIQNNPAYCNIAAYANEWETHPQYNDFMRPSSPVHFTKTFQAEIYENLLAAEFAALGPGSHVIDAGAGVGRMAAALTKTGALADFADSSEKALKTAWRVLCESGARNYDLLREDANDLSTLPTENYDLVLALELLCYVASPEKTIAGLHRILKPGGVIAFSVENKTGAVLGDKNMTIEDVAELSCSDVLCVPGYCYTRYFTRDAAAALAESAGLTVKSVTGCHYLADGPFGAAATEANLSNPDKRARLHRLEHMCRTLPFIEQTARAWLVTATKT